MYIVLDTNVYFNNWFLRSPLFAKLVHYCNDKDATLLLPEVVVEEVQAKFCEETDNALKQLDKARRACENVGHGGVPSANSLTAISYDFREVVREKIRNVVLLPYDTVPHRLLVAKAIGSTRPFTDGEKGYRDALIWHSLIDFLKNEPFKASVAFITENSSDFFEVKSEPIRFYSDLLNDLGEAAVQNRFLLFSSLRQFLDANKILTPEGIDQDRLAAELLPSIETSGEAAAVAYLNQLSAAAAQRLFAEAGFASQACSSLLAAQWEIWEGTEDPQISSAELLDKDTAYVSYDFNLRNVTSRWTVRAADFLQNRNVFEAAFWNAKGDDEFVHLETAARCYFNASFLVDLTLGEVIESSIDKAWLRQYG